MKLTYIQPVKLDGRTLEITDARDVVIVPSILYRGDHFHVEAQKAVAAILVKALNETRNGDDDESDPARTEGEAPEPDDRKRCGRRRKNPNDPKWKGR